MTNSPKTLGKYRITEELGRGSFGVVYLAHDTTLRDRPVALKVLHPQLVVDPDTVGLFREEAGTMAHLEHPHIVTVYEAGDFQVVRFIAMRYVRGRTLAQAIAGEGPQPLERVAGWLEQVASALDYAHGQGMLHRDIKPGNILLDGEDRAVVTDFGLAKAVNASGGSVSSQDRELLSGTAKYMAPEQARGKPVPQSDIYSLGVVLYELLTGQVPFDGDDPFAIAIRHMTEEPVPPRALRPDLSEAVEAVVLRAMVKEPAGRWQSAGEMARAFRLALDIDTKERRGEGRAQMVGAQPLPKTVQLAGRKRVVRLPACIVIAATVVILAAGLGLGLALRGDGGGTPATAIPTTVVAMVTDTSTPPFTVAATSSLVPPPTFTLTPTRTSTPTHTSTFTPTRTRTSTPLPPTRTPTREAPAAGDTMVRTKDGMMVVYVPAGEFMMGSSYADKDANDDEQPRHAVYLDAFWIDKTEVTNAQYGKCVAAGECQIADMHSYAPQEKPNYPVIEVTWNDAQVYCKWAGARLPTEAEWEKAARGNDDRIFPWGNTFSGTWLNFCDQNCGFEWKDTGSDDGHPLLAPVGTYPAGASPYGALDMAGNADEWVADWYDAGYYNISSNRNPVGPTTGQSRVLRGGSCYDNPADVRAANRDSYDPTRRTGRWLGFRCVVSSTASP